MKADVGSDVEATGQIVEGDRTDTHKENTLEVWFEYLEGIAVKTTAVGHVMIGILAQLIENGVGEVVVFVNDEIKMIASLLGFFGQYVDFVLGSSGCQSPFYRVFCIIVLVFLNKLIQTTATVCVEVDLKILYSVQNLGKVELQNLKLAF